MMEVQPVIEGLGAVESVKSSWRRWHLRGALKDGFNYNKQTLCVCSWALWCDVLADIRARGKSRKRASKMAECGVC